MIPAQFPPSNFVSHQFQPFPPFIPSSPNSAVADAFWQIDRVHDHMKSVQENLDLLVAMQKEVEILLHEKCGEIDTKDILKSCGNDVISHFHEILKRKRISLGVQESISLEAVHSLMSDMKNQLFCLNAVTSNLSSQEEISAVTRLSQKMQKSRRNKRWKKKKKRHVAELLRKERANFDKADKEADEWRAREIAKYNAKQKVEKMKEIAKIKANEEKKRLEAELELVLVVEKLQELRSLRIQKLKKQGYFLPEEDDKFLERVRASVEDEECQAAPIADTDVARGAIATTEESRKIHSSNAEVKGDTQHQGVRSDMLEGRESDGDLAKVADMKLMQSAVDSQSSLGGYDSAGSLPFEFYHYYHGSSNDMGTLIEVRRMWDAYIRPGGSRIPGHWVQPPPPADNVWASYLIERK